jgi:hypothetical protein
MAPAIVVRDNAYARLLSEPFGITVSTLCKNVCLLVPALAPRFVDLDYATYFRHLANMLRQQIHRDSELAIQLGKHGAVKSLTDPFLLASLFGSDRSSPNSLLILGTLVASLCLLATSIIATGGGGDYGMLQHMQHSSQGGIHFPCATLF